MATGDNIRRLRKAKGFTQAQLADAVGLTEGAIRHYESGIRAVKPELLELVLGAVMDGLSVRAELNGGSDVSDPELLDSVLDILLNGMRVRDGEGK